MLNVVLCRIFKCYVPLKTQSKHRLMDQVEIKRHLETEYDLSNAILYKLCADNFEHDKVNKILAKTIIIGRTYAVSLNRDRDRNFDERKKSINDDFYQKQVVPIFMKSKLDDQLRVLLKFNSATEALKNALSTHYYLTKKLHRINNQNKRSFSSKYLHFHVPNAFFIYDSRAKLAINEFVKKDDIPNTSKYKFDKEYELFFYKCLFLQKRILESTNLLLTPRQLDNYLLNSANSNLRKRKLSELQTAHNTSLPKHGLLKKF